MKSEQTAWFPFAHNFFNLTGCFFRLDYIDLNPSVAVGLADKQLDTTVWDYLVSGVFYGDDRFADQSHAVLNEISRLQHETSGKIKDNTDHKQGRSY